jgi:uncharacterized membrane protein HdeD (DUF308 family)
MKIDVIIIIIIGLVVFFVPELTLKGVNLNFGSFRYIFGSLLVIYGIFLLKNTK